MLPLSFFQQVCFLLTMSKVFKNNKVRTSAWSSVGVPIHCIIKLVWMSFWCYLIFWLLMKKQVNGNILDFITDFNGCHEVHGILYFNQFNTNFWKHLSSCYSINVPLLKSTPPLGSFNEEYCHVDTKHTYIYSE